MRKSLFLFNQGFIAILRAGSESQHFPVSLSEECNIESSINTADYGDMERKIEENL